MKIKTTKIYNSFLKIYNFVITEGNIIYNREILSRTNDDVKDGSVAVLLIDNTTNDIILVKQPRFGTFKENGIDNLLLTEVIAGTLDNNEQPILCAIREVMEETGYHINLCDIKSITSNSLFVSPGTCTEKIHLFIAYSNKRINDGGGLDNENENISVLKYQISKLDELISTTTDMKTFVLLNWFKTYEANSS